MTDTIESIEREVAGNFLIRRAMNAAVNRTKKVQKIIAKEEGEKAAEQIIKDIISGKKVLNPVEYKAANEKFGLKGLNMIEACEHLNKGQRQYMFKRMGWNPEEVI